MALHTRSALSRLALAVVVSLLGGVLLAGLAFPVVGGLGLAAKSGADDFLRLPDDLDVSALSQQTVIEDVNGKVIARLFNQNRVPTKLGNIQKTTRQALIDIEDARFYSHNGIDYKGTLRALITNSNAGTVQQGGSTLTQQYVKNLLLDSATTKAGQEAATKRDTQRKLQEARYALKLETKLTKDQILEGYLNIAYYANGTYGIGAAALHYYGTNPAGLDLAQGALFAGMVKNPTAYDPQAHPAAAIARRNVVLTQMLKYGHITQAKFVIAVHEKLKLKIVDTSSGCEAPGVTAPFFCDYVRRYLEDGPAGAVLGATREERQQRLLNGGLIIRTTLDPTVQQGAQEAVDDNLPPTDPYGAVGVVDTVQPGSGAVRAMAVDRPYGSKKGQTKLNYALGGSVGLQGGSTFKAFVLAAAIRQGLPTSTAFSSPRHYCPPPSDTFPYPLKKGGCGVSNAGDSEAGYYDMASGAWDSVNTYFLQLEEKTGLDDPTQIAAAMGVKDLYGTPLRNPSFFLGTNQVSPLAMAGAYATFADHGTFCPPTPIVSITDSYKKSLHVPYEGCRQVLDPTVADTVTGILRGVVDGYHAKTGGAASLGDTPAAGKTGTAQENKSAFFIGFTPQLATAVWMGKPTPVAMQGVVINGVPHGEIYGATICAPIWRQSMQAALATDPVNLTGRDLAPIVESHPGYSSGYTSRGVSYTTGDTVAVATAKLQAKGFTVVLGPTVEGGSIPAGNVVSSSPAAGSFAPSGSTVTLNVSNGTGQGGDGTGAQPSPTAAPAGTIAPAADPSPVGKPRRSPRR